MVPARSFRELKVYEKARDAAKQVFLVSKEFLREERFALTDQRRRSSREAKAMLAGARARRRYYPAFINKIDEALGEANETQSWLDDALDAQYLPTATFNDLNDRYQAIGGMLSPMIDRADDFCKRAPATDYRTVVREEEFPFTDH